MIKEFKDEFQAKAIAESLGLIITKYRGVYTVSNSKEELLVKYNLAYYSKDGIFYDKEVFEIGESDYLCIKNKEIIDASSIELPYSIRDCSYMFWACTSLEIPPVIPKGVENCTNMFYGCTSLKTPPILPDGVRECIETFRNCTSLETPPIIPDGVQDCYSMFQQCTTLETPPSIPKSVEDCSYMFYGCTSLKKRPRFPKNGVTTGALWNTPFERG